MEAVIDWLLRRKHVEHNEGRGLSLAIQTIEEFVGRTFSCPETTPKTSGIRRKEILELIQQELPVHYDYTIRVKTYLNRKGIPQAQINRPHPEITFGKMLEGLVKFRDEYAGRYWLEILLLGGVTTVETQVSALTHAIKLIDPDKVHVHTVSRPPAEDFAMAVSQKQLKEIASQLSDKAEVILPNRDIQEQQETSARTEDILALLRRRPCSIEDIALGLGLHHNTVIKSLEQLCSRQQAQAEHTTRGLFYRAHN